VEILICLLNALNTNDSKSKHLNADLQRPAVHTSFRNIYLFKQRRKEKFQKIFFFFLKQKTLQNQFAAFSTN